MSGHVNKTIERGIRTLWGWQREGLVRTWKETDRARRTHVLETAERGTCQDTERIRPSKAHSRPGDDSGRDLSEHGKETNRAGHTHKLGMAERETCQDTERNRPRNTHFLKTAESETCQDTERKRQSKAHSRPGDGRERDLSGHGKKPTEQGTLTNWRRQGERLVRARKEIDRARYTHSLETS